MNAIRATQALNKRELENAVPPSASWHVDYRDTAYIYIGGLPLDLSEGDVIVIFSQYGNPTHLNMIRDKETGKSKGFAFLKYEDQRSCDLAVDNLGGAEVLGRMLRVDHTRYKKKDDEDEDTYRIDKLEAETVADEGRDMDGKRASDTENESHDERRRRKKRRLLKEEEELEQMLAIKQDGEEEDPMRDYLIREKREEVAKARQREDERERKHKHRHRHQRPRDEDDRDSKHRSKHKNEGEKDEDKKSRRDERERGDRDRESHRHRESRYREEPERRNGHRRRERSQSSDSRDRRKRGDSRDRRHRDRSREHDKYHKRKDSVDDRDRDRRRRYDSD